MNDFVCTVQIYGMDLPDDKKKEKKMKIRWSTNMQYRFNNNVLLVAARNV